MRPKTQRQIRRFAWVVIIGTGIGIGYGSLKGFALQAPLFVGGLIGAIHGATIAGAIGLMEIVAVQTRMGRMIEQSPMMIVLLIKGSIYTAVIIGVEATGFGERLIGLQPRPFLQSPFAPLSVCFSFVFIATIIFMLQVSRIIGHRALRDLVLGRYHQPRLEQRFFLFVDIVGSTGLAERLGPLAAHHFLNRVFSLAADPVADHAGEIYQYVGDEMVVTWTGVGGAVQARPIASFYAIEDALNQAAPHFKRNFGSIPRLRAALHAGAVVTGEIGESKRAIVFHGDVMNTTSRLEQATRELDCQFLISDDALNAMAHSDAYRFQSMGWQSLHGRKKPIHTHAVFRRDLQGASATEP